MLAASVFHIAVRLGTADTAADTVVALINRLVGKVAAEVVIFTFTQFHIRQTRITCFFCNNAVEFGSNRRLPQMLGVRH